MDTTPQQLNAADVAEFLRLHPDFFQQYADVFAHMAVPHPQQGRVISLGERQILLLRDKNKLLDKQLATLLHNARRNENINKLLHKWYCDMLAEPDAQQLPNLISTSLQTVFELSLCQLKVWSQQTPHTELSDYLKQHPEIYCGPARSESIWHDLQQSCLSVAIVPITVSNGLQGVLLLGAHDATRFTRDMDTNFLAQIGLSCRAALQRLTLDEHGHSE